MNTMVRTTLDGEAELRAFSATVPSPTAGETAANTDLDQAYTGLKADAAVEADARLDRRNATATKQSQRRKLQRGLRHLSDVAHRAMVEVPGTEIKVDYASHNAPDQQFMVVCKAALANAMAAKDLLVQHGLAESVLAEFGAALDQFEKSLAQADAARQAHVVARSKMLSGSRKVRRIARVLDTLYRARFQDDPDTLRKWQSASAALRTHSRARGSAPAGTQQSQPSGTNVRPAA
jgi:hypothetical protein